MLLTHWNLETQIRVNQLGYLDQWLVAYTTLSHYLNQYWLVNWVLRIKLEWHFNRNSSFSFENVLHEISAILFNPCCVKGSLSRSSIFLAKVDCLAADLWQLTCVCDGDRGGWEALGLESIPAEMQPCNISPSLQVPWPLWHGITW